MSALQMGAGGSPGHWDACQQSPVIQADRNASLRLMKGRAVLVQGLLRLMRRIPSSSDELEAGEAGQAGTAAAEDCYISTAGLSIR